MTVQEKISETLSAFSEQLKSRNSFLLITHRRPDGDTVCSAAALCHALRQLGKDAYLAVNPEITERYAKYADILFAPAGFEAEAIVTVDVSAVQQFENTQRAYLDRIDFVIDHHKRNDLQYSQACLIDEDAAATGEIVYYLIEAMGVEMDSLIAELIYIAISTDTGCFRYANTTEETHLIAGKCIAREFDVALVNREQFETKTKARFAIERLVVNTLTYYLNGRVASIIISQKMRDDTGATEDDVDEFSSIPRQIAGVEVGLAVYEQKDGSMKISVRSNGTVDASAICRVFGGGGHKNAAGCTINADFEGTLKVLVSEVEKVL